MFLVLALLLYHGASALTISCVGDSITEKGGASHPSKSYPTLLQDLLPSSYDVKNFGRSGATMIEHPDDSYRERDEYEDALESDPDLVTIMLGTNDAKGEFWDDESPDDYTDSFEDLVQTFRDLGAIVVVMIPVPQLKASSKWPDPDVINEVIPSLVEKVAQKVDAPLVDMRVPLLVDGEVDEDLYDDSIHPNDVGNEKMAAHLKEQLQALGLLNAPTYSPTVHPTYKPTLSTTSKPTEMMATYAPTTTKPTKLPTYSPTRKPTAPSPTYSPTARPTSRPSTFPRIYMPTARPTPKPSSKPTRTPTPRPTQSPSTTPITVAPSESDVNAQTSQPSFKPTSSKEATIRDSPAPSTSAPTISPSLHPTTRVPTTRKPTTHLPSQIPTSIEKDLPTAPSASPSRPPVVPRPTTPSPSLKPSSHPSTLPPSARRTSTPSTPMLVAISSSVRLVTKLNATRFNSDSEIKASFAKALVQTTSAAEVSNVVATNRRRLQEADASSLTVDFDALVLDNVDFDVDVGFLSALDHPAFADALFVNTETSEKKKKNGNDSASVFVIVAIVLAAVVFCVLVGFFALRNRRSCECCPYRFYHGRNSMQFKNSEASLSDSDKDLYDDVLRNDDELPTKPDVTPSQYADFFGLSSETKEQYFWERDL